MELVGRSWIGSSVWRRPASVKPIAQNEARTSQLGAGKGIVEIEIKTVVNSTGVHRALRGRRPDRSHRHRGHEQAGTLRK